MCDKHAGVCRGQAHAKGSCRASFNMSHIFLVSSMVFTLAIENLAAESRAAATEEGKPARPRVSANDTNMLCPVDGENTKTSLTVS